MPSGLDRWEEEWKEEDLEDLEPVRSGGESGAMEMEEVMAWSIMAEESEAVSDGYILRRTGGGPEWVMRPMFLPWAVRSVSQGHGLATGSK